MARTTEMLATELDVARRAGSVAEMADLSLLITNADRPKGTPALPGAKEAGNRQAQRRYNRTHTRDQNGARNPHRRAPAVGDHIRTPDGRIWPVTRVDGKMIWSDLGPGTPLNSCPIEYCTIVDLPAPSGPPVATQAPTPAGETLYHACWDALESNDWMALEGALRAYEASLT